MVLVELCRHWPEKGHEQITHSRTHARVALFVVPALTSLSRIPHNSGLSGGTTRSLAARRPLTALG